MARGPGLHGSILLSIHRFPGYQRIRRNLYVPDIFDPANRSLSSAAASGPISTCPSSQATTGPRPKASSSKTGLETASTGKLSLSIASRFSPARRGGSFSRDQERSLRSRTTLRS